MGMAVSVAAFALLVTFSSIYGEAIHVASCVVFGLTLVLFYTAFERVRRAKSDSARRAAIGYRQAASFLLVGGTATPFLLASVGGPWGWSLFGVVWGLCLIGAVVRVAVTGPVRSVATAVTALLGVAAVIAYKPVFANVSAGALVLILSGALCYAVARIFRRWPQLRYNLSVHHGFAIGGTLCHVLAVLLFVLPVA
jgi:hemolysin III